MTLAACGSDSESSPTPDTVGGDAGDVSVDTDLPDGDGDGGADAVDASDASDGTDPDTSDVTDAGDATDGGGGDVVAPGPATETVVCRELAPTTNGGRCEVTRDGNALLIQGTVLGSETTYVGGEILIAEDGVIACVGCDCFDQAAALSASLVACPGQAISPGLINAHDHITFTGLEPGEWGDERFEHRHDWRRGLRGHSSLSTPSTSARTTVQWGELRQLVTGTTSVAGSGRAEGFLRNIDREESDIGVEDINYNTFPLGDSGAQFRTNDCSYPNIETDPGAGCYLAHVAEGIDNEARNEFLCLSSTDRGGQDVTEPNAAFIHLIGLNAFDGAELAASATSLIWSPRSNIALYGNTAPVTMFHQQGVRIGLGTDWTPSGSVNIVRELACAAELNETYFNNTFADDQLWLMATGWAADALKIEAVLGRLEPGLFADISIFEIGDSSSPHRAIIDASPADIVLVLQSGLPMVGDSDVMAELPLGQAGCQEVILDELCGKPTTICSLRETGQSYEALDAANTSNYDLAFCEPPADEPSCIPFRPGEYDGIVTDADLDGDGVANDADNCPRIFNPIRPMDGGVQADADEDGAGDQCDVCPLDANTEICTAFNPNDPDGDGFEGLDDNCPRVANDQLDTDNDGLGDACDPCPEFANVGGACGATIYALKQGDVAFGSSVIVEGVVTAVGPQQFFLQTADADRDPELGARFSGVYIYTNDVPTVMRGQRVSVSGEYSEFNGQGQIGFPTSVVEVEGATEVSATVVAAADVATEGDLADDYESVLITVEGEIVELNPAAGGGQTDPTGELVVEGGFRVGTLMFTIAPAADLGDAYRLTGAMRFANANTKLEPRDADDVVLTVARAAQLIGFDREQEFLPEFLSEHPAEFARVQILVDRPAPVGGLVVSLSSSDPIAVVVADVTIPEGMTSAEFDIMTTDGQLEPITLTATLDELSATMQIVVIAADREAVLNEFEPEMLRILFGQSASVEVFFDIPVQGETVELVFAQTGELELTLPDTQALEVGALSALVDVTASDAIGTGTVSFQIGEGPPISIVVEVTDAPDLPLVLSEVYYDNPGGDDGSEWIELYNGNGVELDLSDYSIGAGGRTYDNATYALSGTIPAFGCIVVGGPTSAAANGSPTIDFVLNFEPDIQNSGDNADAIGLFELAADAITASSVPLDAVIYGGSNDDDFVDATGATGAVSVGDAFAGTTIERTVDGWVIQETPTPGVCAVSGR